jgi:hypothetical protein
MHKRTKKQFPYRNRVWKIQIKSTLSVRNTVFGEIGLLIIRNLFPFLPIFPGNGMGGKEDPFTDISSIPIADRTHLEEEPARCHPMV